jgi:hypothetical protein
MVVQRLLQGRAVSTKMAYDEPLVLSKVFATLPAGLPETVKASLVYWDND